MLYPRLSLGLLSLATLAGSVRAQTPAAPPRTPPVPVVQPSSFATEEVRLNGRLIGGQWFPSETAVEGPSVIRISYGQPHARGRQIIGGVVPVDSVWRLGANLATTLHTDVDITLGTTFVPHGTYTLFALPARTGWQLIVSRETSEWGTDYDPSKDLARIPLQVQTLTGPVESLSIYLVPTLDPQGAPRTMPHGTLRITWGNTAATTTWRMGR